MRQWTILMMVLASVVLASALEIAPAAAEAGSCLDGARTAHVQGRLQRQTFAGPPNYTSVDEGDRPETFFVLVLGQRLCVQEDQADATSSASPVDIDSVQLVLSAPQYAQYRSLIGRPVIVTGKWMNAVTGHHYTPLPLTDVSMAPER